MKCEVNGVVLNVVERGGERRAGIGIINPTLVFLHYFGGSSRAWAGVVARLETEYRCLAPDLRGFGDSDAPAAGYAVSDYADDIAALIRALGVERYVLVGHSMGGKIASALAARQPPNLESLALIAPSPPTPEPIPEDERARLLRTHGDRAAAEKTARQIAARPLPAPLLEQVVEDALQSSGAAWRAWLERGSRENIAESMKGIRVPVSIAVGEADAVLPPRLVEREVASRIEGASLTIVPRAGHLLPLEDAKATAEFVREHCRRRRITQG